MQPIKSPVESSFSSPITGTKMGMRNSCKYTKPTTWPLEQVTFSIEFY